MLKERNTALIRSKAIELGFMQCGFSKAEFLESEAPHLEQWLNKGFQGKMSYMENHFDKRLDPRLLVDDAKTVISLTLNYFPGTFQEENDAPRISKYAYGKDYHYVIKDKLKDLVGFIAQEIGEVNARVFVDSAPVLDKAWAEKSGIGWVGKNANLINPKNGSFFFVAEIICDLELIYDSPIKDYCGTCTKCMDACPTGAIVGPKQVDGSKCISYLTIELKDELLPGDMKGKLGDWMFGCDVCQDVCPWNRFSKPTQISGFLPDERLLHFTRQDWTDLTEEIFRELFRHSAVKRTGFKGLKRNIDFLD